jgi:MFS superfamily sulfate permease-like transporter
VLVQAIFIASRNSKVISPTDPAARYTASANSVAGYAYSDNYLIDLKHAVIMDVETTNGRQAEVGAAKTEAAFGREGLVPMTFLAGCYQVVCSLLNAFEIPAPAHEASSLVE